MLASIIIHNVSIYVKECKHKTMKKNEKDLSKAKGGHARAKALSKQERAEIAKKAADARWGKDLLQASCEGVIPSLNLSSYVLEDETRVLSRISFLQALGWTGKAKGGRKYDEEFQKPVFMTAETLKPFISKELSENSAPVHFAYKGQRMIGYKAELLPQVCEMYLKYRDYCVENNKKILRQYEHIIVESEILMRAFAQTGIIALVDEATGYQYIRTRNALEGIFEAFIAKELQKWVKTFPDEFYYQICRLKGWKYDDENKHKRGMSWGRLTNYLIYRRLAPAVLEELKRLTPKNAKGRHKNRLFQRLTEDIGHPRLRELLASEITLMRIFDDGDWETFEEKLNIAIPVYTPLPLFDQYLKETENKDNAKLLH